jgi:alpha-beta hydrolase superfamily lysophospholipase
MRAMAVPTLDDVARGARPFSWEAPDGSPFPALAWEPGESGPRANVLCIHGLGGAAVDFGPVGRALADAGCSVRAINLRGQGNDPDPSRRGHLLDPSAWREDLAAFAATFGAAAPLCVVGESMGALVAVDATASGALRPERLVLSVPVTETRAPVPRWVVSLLRSAAVVCPRLRLSALRFVHGRTSLPRLTADEEYMAYLETIPHRVGGFTIEFLARFDTLMESCRCCAGRIEVPTLMLAAGRDVFIKPEQSRRFFEQVGARDKRFHFYPESHHLLWHDRDRDDVLGRIRAWVLGEDV